MQHPSFFDFYKRFVLKAGNPESNPAAYVEQGKRPEISLPECLELCERTFLLSKH